MDNSVIAFIEQARRYCALLEDGGSPNSWVFARQCLSSVLRLYDGALLLPQFEPTAEVPFDRITHEEEAAIRKRISDILQRDFYWQIFEPLEADPPNPVAGSLSDDLADIWRDLKEGLRALDDNTQDNTADVVWQWRLLFETHWGNHAVGAIGGLNGLCFGAFADAARPRD